MAVPHRLPLLAWEIRVTDLPVSSSRDEFMG